MLLPNHPLPISKSKCAMILILLMGGMVAISGCTIQPLYSVGDSKSGRNGSLTPGMRTKLASIAIDPVDTRYAQEIRNKLIFLLSGGMGEPTNPIYHLSLGISSVTTGAVNLDFGDLTNTAGRPSAGTVRLTSNYVLRNATNIPVAKGTRVISASFDRPRQEFANLSAEQNAQYRAAEELAEQLLLAIVQNLSKL